MTDQTNAATAERAAREAAGALAMEENLKAVAELADSADQRQQAEHIRGIVATTIGRLSSDATAVTHEYAAQWKAWALGLTEGADGAVPSAT
ncbi:hypothetical protein HLB44_26720 [Aquincola sp. S2]|uniref:Uncharacterized protein n=1 Tax=Pseudaquabacterium terrae TaxID=2732868 RepID=A0ABX2EPN2_9BURK|nr:hypothetical protein [Aquabacterium terrae]NRF70602.1 hypothetical protein [Aquabacterium terrae]